MVIDNLSLRLDASTSCLLVGDNGSGKSTIGRLFTGVLAPKSGEIKLFGDHIYGLKGSTRVRRALYLNQNIHLNFIKSSIRDEIKFSCKVAGREWPDARMIQKFDLPDLDTVPLDLTISESWRLLFLIGHIVSPDLLFIDEFPSVVHKQNMEHLSELMARRKHESQITVVAYQRDVSEAPFDLRFKLEGGRLVV